MNTNWGRRSEPRTLRPFFGVQSIEDATNEATVKITRDGEPSSQENISVDDFDLGQLQISIMPNININDLPSGFTKEDLELVIFGHNSLLKKSIFIKKCPLSEPLPDEQPIPKNILKKLGGGRGLSITVAIILGVNKERSAGLPFSKGHWLSKKTFHLQDDRQQNLYDIKTRTSEEWEKHQFPPDTLYSVEYLGGINEEGDGSSPVADIYIHKDAYDRMAVAGGKLEKILTPMLTVEMIAQVLEQSYYIDDWGDKDEATTGSPLLKISQDLTGESSLARLKGYVTKAGHLRAHIQTRCNTLKSIMSGTV